MGFSSCFSPLACRQLCGAAWRKGVMGGATSRRFPDRMALHRAHASGSPWTRGHPPTAARRPTRPRPLARPSFLPSLLRRRHGSGPCSPTRCRQHAQRLAQPSRTRAPGWRGRMARGWRMWLRSRWGGATSTRAREAPRCCRDSTCRRACCRCRCRCRCREARPGTRRACPVRGAGGWQRGCPSAAHPHPATRAAGSPGLARSLLSLLDHP